MTSPTKRKSRKDKKQQGRVSGFVLSVIDGQAAGREYHFETDATVGRVENNDVIMVDPGISRNHARFQGRRGVYLVEDLGSSNGTRLNGELIEGPEVLRDGDYVGIGQATVQFSNLDMERAGDVTARIRLSEKQARRLDHPGSLMGANPKEQLKALWKTPRGRLMAIGGALAGLLLLVGLVKQCGGKDKGGHAQDQELSATPVDYDQYQSVGYTDWAFGYGEFNRNYRDKVIFRYVKPPQKLRITLEYAAWGIDDPEEVVIFVNDKRVGSVPRTRQYNLHGKSAYEYEYGLRLEIAPEAFRDGENTVVFDNTKNGPDGKDRWEISYVKLRETAIPLPNQEKAKECFFNAKNAYEQRNVDPANLQRAIGSYECARDYLEELPQKPPEYQESRQQIDLINRELNKIFSGAIFDAQQSYRRGQPDEARTRLEQTMLYFLANQQDPRYLQLRQVLESFGQ